MGELLRIRQREHEQSVPAPRITHIPGDHARWPRRMRLRYNLTQIGRLMEIHFTPEQESQLGQIARSQGKSDAGELLHDAGLRLLEEEARFRAAVLEGKAQADRGEFIEEAEMDARFEELLRS